MPSTPNKTQRAYIYAGLAYLAFVIYGSLVPLDFNNRSWDDALQAFSQIPFLNLGIESRADWIANILLYIPLTYIWSDILIRPNHPALNVFASFSILASAIALSIGIEFAQLFFPPRTVSLNDLLAETIGSVAGIVLWHAFGTRISGWVADLRSDGNTALTAALSLYLLGYIAYSLFPFDFVVTSDELSARLANGRNSLLISTEAYSSVARCLLQLLLEIIAAIPLGVFVARLTKSPHAPRIGIALLAGATLGLLIEGAQLFLNSGVAQGISVLTRCAGAVLGAIIFRRLMAARTIPFFGSRQKKRLLIILIAPAYLAGLAIIQNWKINDWLSWENGLARLPQVHFLPFYYHYFTTETAALSSLLLISAAFAPIGVMFGWLTGTHRNHGMIVPVILASLISAACEFAKLFQSNLHPDPTNILIAATAAAAGYWLMRWLSELFALPSTTIRTPAKNRVKTTATEPATSPHQPDPASRGSISLLALLSLVVLAWAVSSYPLAGYWLAGGLLVYLTILRLWPQAWLVIVPAALPVLDMTPWTGRFFFDEFDCLLLATIAVAGWRRPVRKTAYRLSATSFLIFALFSLSAAAALLIGAYPYPSPDLNSFSNYYSPYNALRVGKGLLWALFLLPLLKIELDRNAAKAHRLFSTGMTMGVLTAVISALWERLAFTGLFNFSTDYRVVGLFSGTHTGGAYLEAFLVAAMPFVAWRTLTSQRWTERLFGAAVFMLGSYAVMVTYARGGYIALALGMVVLVTGLLFSKTISWAPMRAAGVIAMLLLLAGIAWPALHGSFMQDRLSKTEHDLHARTAHWKDALQMMDDGITTRLFGMGLGRYPETYFWRSTEGIRPATYSFMKEPGNTYLALGAGSPLYFEQLVDIRPGQHYRLNVDARSKMDKAELTLSVCEKWMLYSANCVWHTLPIGNTNGEWRPFPIEIDTGKLPAHPWYERPTIKLSLLNPTTGSVLNIDKVSIKSADGKELLQNGEFTRGMSNWFFAVDKDLPWHIWNLWMQVYFEQGAIGLCLFVWLIVHTFITLARRYREKELPIPALTASLTGFLTVGVIDSLFDSPRLALMFYMLAAWAVLQPRRRVA